MAARLGGHRLLPLATALLDGDGRFLHWSEDAEALLGYSAEEAVGSFAAQLLLADEQRPAALGLFDRVTSGRGWSGVFPVRHRDGHQVELEFRTYPIAGPDGRLLVLATASDVRALNQVEADLVILDGYFTQSPIGLAVYDTDLRFVRINPALAQMNGLSSQQHLGRRLSEALPGINAAEIEEAMRHVLATGEPVLDARSHGRTPGNPEHDRAWSASYFRMESPSGQILGVASSIIDVTERFRAEAQAARAQERLTHLAEATARIGTTLDLRRTARELAGEIVPRLADLCGVLVRERLLADTDPEVGEAAGTMLVRRLALAAAHPRFPIEDLPTEGVYRLPPGSPYTQAMVAGRTLTVSGRNLPPLADNPFGGVRSYLRHETQPLQVSPLVARGTVLGVVVYARHNDREPFDAQDFAFGDELVSRAAVSIDNARLYLHEHETLRQANAAREQLALLNEASTRIGTTLDLQRTAEELVEVVLPRFADFVTVDLLDPVLRGDEPYKLRDDQSVVLRTVAVGDAYASGLTATADAVGEASEFDPARDYAKSLRTGQSILVPEVDETSLAGIVSSQDRVAPALAAGIHSFLMVPVLARGAVLGGAEFFRTRNPEPFTPADVALAEELVARAAVSIDNARLYRREHETALILQRGLLSQHIRPTPGVEIAYRYLPSSVVSEVGGDWFDVVPLSGDRLALIVGDVMGHGMRAAATMGQLRTVARTLATLDLTPDQVLTRLDETAADIGEGQFATCVCAVYDPADRSCTAASAGHLPPVVVARDGSTQPIELPPAVPLGVGGAGFESVKVTIPEDGILVLYTDGLIERRGQDIDQGMNLLCRTLADRGRNLEETCDAVLAALETEGAEDDIAVIMAHVLPPPEGHATTR
ncbi:SpoIIE family protein phosphatase [Kitasatospora sp. GP82]|uniref:SpoIIE family protein phosphatase n=1 Tax=Kitasatospora sp. GP82 TaxID=3035089 RepID=UPI0024754198|nr:SpoIIE family protein phosphatase [Kitasatospora sp. GP82]